MAAKRTTLIATKVQRAKDVHSSDGLVTSFDFRFEFTGDDEKRNACRRMLSSAIGLAAAYGMTWAQILSPMEQGCIREHFPGGAADPIAKERAAH